MPLKNTGQKPDAFFKKMKTISYQGEPGAWSDIACRAMFPHLKPVPCRGFEDAFKAVKDGRADLAMIPVDNTLAGRVADVHHLIPKGDLYIVGEHFQPIQMALLGVKGAKISDLTDVYSHIHALPQCRKIIKKLGLEAHVAADTARAAADVAEWGDKTRAAIASPLNAKIYGLQILQEGIQDAENNVTRFQVWAGEPNLLKKGERGPYITSFIFGVRNIPAALYKALGGFATNGVNVTKIESYIDQRLNAAQFLCEVEGHPDDVALRNALEELNFFASHVRMLGTYKGHTFRTKG
jgi:prephenate dehydratase